MLVEFNKPTGFLVEGHIFDVDKESFTAALHEIDPLLYVKWNPYKCKGYGCWEIRRKPAQPILVDTTNVATDHLLIFDTQENSVVHHVLDCAFLNYDQIRKVKSMDTAGQDFGAWLDNKEAEYREEAAERGKRAIADTVSQFRKELTDLQEAVKNGANLAEIALHWNSAKELE